MPAFVVPAPSTAIVAALFALFAVGCGGDSDPVAPGSGAAPTVSLTAPANLSAGLTGTLVLAAAASDPDGNLAAVEFQIDGVTIGTPVTSAPYTASIDAAQYTMGQHIIRARATDTAGNTSDWATSIVQIGGTRTEPAGFTRNEGYVTGLTGSTAIAQAPDGRLFIAEEAGNVRVVKDGVLLATPFLTVPVDTTGERGLIGITFHPNFATNGFVYVHYTTFVTGGSRNRISRFTASGDVAAAGSEAVLVELPLLDDSLEHIHNGGAIHFGPDGKLYAGVGENAIWELAQDLTTPLGKLLRFNDDGSIPSDNPICTTQGNLACAIWAYGLRNPFTFAIQPGTGRIHVNDVGQASWEEVNLIAKGKNYGWPQSEGPDNVTTGITGPLFAYNHDPATPPGSLAGNFIHGNGGGAIAGGAFYPANGSFGAPWRGGYFFSDFVNRFVVYLDLANGNAAYTFGHLTDRPVDMRVAADNSLLVLTRSGITRFSKN
jgi:glucose/arabinose dehydrogenase